MSFYSELEISCPQPLDCQKARAIYFMGLTKEDLQLLFAKGDPLAEIRTPSGAMKWNEALPLWKCRMENDLSSLSHALSDEEVATYGSLIDIIDLCLIVIHPADRGETKQLSTALKLALNPDADFIKSAPQPFPAIVETERAAYESFGRPQFTAHQSLLFAGNRLS